MRFRAEDLRPHGWQPPPTLQIPDWCGCSTEYLPVPTGEGWWQLVPVWNPDQDTKPLATVGAPSAAMGGRHMISGEPAALKHPEYRIVLWLGGCQTWPAWSGRLERFLIPLRDVT